MPCLFLTALLGALNLSPVLCPIPIYREISSRGVREELMGLVKPESH